MSLPFRTNRPDSGTAPGSAEPLPGPVLALAELEALAGAGQAVLLAFLGALVARQQAGLLEAAAQFAVVQAERTRDAQAQCAGHPGDAAARRGRDDVELVERLGEHERRADLQAQ